MNQRTSTFLHCLKSCISASSGEVISQKVNVKWYGLCLLLQHRLPLFPHVTCQKQVNESRNTLNSELIVQTVKTFVTFGLFPCYVCHVPFLCIPCLYSLSYSRGALLINLIRGNGIQIKRKIRGLCDQSTKWQQYVQQKKCPWNVVSVSSTLTSQSR